MKGKEFLLLACLLLVLLCGFLLRADGGINLDALMYARMAEDFPALKSNVFPFGQALALRIFKTFCGDYFIASKCLNFCCMLAVLVFSFRKKFFFFGTLLLFSLKTGTGLWSMSYSEPLFLTFFWFWLYVGFQTFQNQSFSSMNAVLLSLLLLCMTFVRHTGVFIWAGWMAALVWLYFLNSHNSGLRKFLIKSGTLSSALLFAYLICDYLIFGSLFGEQERGNPDIRNRAEFWNHLMLNAKGCLSLANPFFTFVFQHAAPGEKTLLQLLILFLDLVFLSSAVYLIIKKKNELHGFPIVLLCLTLGYALLLFLSSLQAGIEIINLRLISPASFALFFGLIVLYRTEIQRFSKSFLVFSLLAAAINLAILLKSPFPYPLIREKAMTLLKAKPYVRYMITDCSAGAASVYKIPFLNSEFRYRHANLDPNHIALMAYGILRPELSILKDTSGIGRSEILRASELK